jgi:hypothetical protein
VCHECEGAPVIGRVGGEQKVARAELRKRPHPLDALLGSGEVDRMLEWAGESQYYVEPRRLARLGYLDARKEPGKTRERTVYDSPARTSTTGFWHSLM